MGDMPNQAELLHINDALRAENAKLRAENEQLCLQREGLLCRVAELRADNAHLIAEANEAHGIIDVLSGQIKQLHDDDARLRAAIWEEAHMNDSLRRDRARLRSLLRAVVREADRETNAFIAARAELDEQAEGIGQWDTTF